MLILQARWICNEISTILENNVHPGCTSTLELENGRVHPQNHLATTWKVYFLLRRPAQLQIVAENDHFWCGAPPSNASTPVMERICDIYNRRSNSKVYRFPVFDRWEALHTKSSRSPWLFGVGRVVATKIKPFTWLPNGFGGVPDHSPALKWMYTRGVHYFPILLRSHNEIGEPALNTEQTQHASQLFSLSCSQEILTTVRG